MEYLALYRKYRPNNLDDIVGQDKIVQTIRNSIINNKISHAYLFSGPRGTGKTTLAKVVAKMVNCDNLVDGHPCNECENCKNFYNNTDIVEIDAASNNGVDEIRELRDKINLVPSNSKYKVYIIDEVHMLTTQAFNALLKTLEEPPGHVIFILATTEQYKIPVTVSSRCQKFQFYKISNEKIVERLSYIASKENIEISKEALFEIARLSDGGMRDAINTLDQLYSFKNDAINIEDVYEVCGVFSYVDIYNFLECIANSDTKSVINFIDDIDKTGKSISKFIEEIIIFLKDELIFVNSGGKSDIDSKNDKFIDVSKKYSQYQVFKLINLLNDAIINIKSYEYPNILLTVSVLKFINDEFSTSTVVIQEKDNIYTNMQTDVLIKKEKETSNKSKIPLNVSEEVVSADVINNRINNTFATASKNSLDDIKNKWKSLNEKNVGDEYNAIIGIINDISPVAAGNEYIIFMSNIASIVDRFNSNVIKIENLLNEVYNKKYKVIALIDKQWLLEKNKYIENKAIGYKYEVIVENTKKSEKKIKNVSDIDELTSLLGNEIIEYK